MFSEYPTTNTTTQNNQLILDVIESLIETILERCPNGMEAEKDGKKYLIIVKELEKI